MAQRRDSTLIDRREEPAEAPARRLVEEDALDRLRGAKLERLFERRFLEVSDP
jgi:hypothetical protein